MKPAPPPLAFNLDYYALLPGSRLHHLLTGPVETVPKKLCLDLVADEVTLEDALRAFSLLESYPEITLSDVFRAEIAATVEHARHRASTNPSVAYLFLKHSSHLTRWETYGRSER